jgi:hypothetical protein
VAGLWATAVLSGNGKWYWLWFLTLTEASSEAECVGGMSATDNCFHGCSGMQERIVIVGGSCVHTCVHVCMCVHVFACVCACVCV